MVQVTLNSYTMHNIIGLYSINICEFSMPLRYKLAYIPHSSQVSPLIQHQLQTFIHINCEAYVIWDSSVDPLVCLISGLQGAYRKPPWHFISMMDYTWAGPIDLQQYYQPKLGIIWNPWCLICRICPPIPCYISEMLCHRFLNKNMKTKVSNI